MVNEAGGVAKFTSLLTQYGTGFAVAQKIAKKLFGKAAKTKLAEKAAKLLQPQIKQLIMVLILQSMVATGYYLHLQLTRQYLLQDKNLLEIYLVMNRR